MVKTLPPNVGDVRDSGSIPGSGRSPGGGHGNSLQYSWRIPWTEEPGGLQSLGSQSRTGLKRLCTHAAESYLRPGGTQHSLGRPGLTGSLEKVFRGLSLHCHVGGAEG